MRHNWQGLSIWVFVLGLSLVMGEVGMWAGEAGEEAREFVAEKPEPIGNGDGKIWVIPSLSSPSVKNGGKLKIQAVVKAAAGVRSVTAEIVDGERVVDTVALSAGAESGITNSELRITKKEGVQAGGFAPVGIWETEWTAKGLEEKYYTVRLRVTDSAGHVFEDTSLTFSDPVAGVTEVGTTQYANGGMARVGSIPLLDEGNLVCAVLVDGYAYFGTDTTPGRVIKINLSTFTHVETITLNTGENYLRSAFTDSNLEYIYFGTDTYPGRIIKVRLSDFSRIGAVKFAAGENRVYCGVIDPVDRQAYFGTVTNPGHIVKVDLTTFTRTDGMVCDSGESYLWTAQIDTTTRHGYFGTKTSTGCIIKLDLETFTKSGVLTTNSLNGGISTSVIDEESGFAYFGTDGVPATIYRVNLNTFEAAGTINLEPGEDWTASATIDTANGFAYFGTNTGPGRVVKIDLATFTRVGATMMGAGEATLAAAVFDPETGHAYFGTYSNRGRVAKVDTASMTRVGGLLFGKPEEGLLGAVYDPEAGFAYFTSNAGIIKVDLVNFQKVATLPTASAVGSPAVIDPSHGYAYFAAPGSPPGVMRVKLSDFSLDGVLAFEVSEVVHSAVIDTEEGFAYFGTYMAPGKVIKVDLSTFTRVATLTLSSGENYLTKAIIDSVAGFAYFITSTSTSIVVRINLNTFTRVDALTLSSGEGPPGAAVIDPVAGYAYLGTNGLNKRIVKINVANLSRVGALAVNPEEGLIESGVIDTVRGFACFGARFNGGQARAIKIDLENFIRVGSADFFFDEIYASSAVLDADSGSAYFGTLAAPGFIVQIATSQKGLMKGMRVELLEHARVSDITMYSHVAAGSTRLSVYDDSIPRNILWQSLPVPNNVASGWLNVPISSGSPVSLVLTPGDYWLAWQVDTTADVPSYVPGVSGDGFYMRQAFGPAPGVIDPADATVTNEKWSMYLNYEVEPVDEPNIVSNNIPAQMGTGHDMPVRVVMMNVGNTTWSAAGGYALGVVSDSCSMITANRIGILNGETVEPGESYTFEVMLDVPAAPGACGLEFQMVRDVEVGPVIGETKSDPARAVTEPIFFGPVLSVNPNVVTAVNGGQFVSETIPAKMAPGQATTYTVQMKNTGNTAWFPGSNHSLAVLDGACMGFAPGNRLTVRAGESVMPGQSYNFFVHLTAPGGLGPCGIEFRMVEEFVAFFGDTVNAVVNVEVPANAVGELNWERYE